MKFRNLISVVSPSLEYVRHSHLQKLNLDGKYNLRILKHITNASPHVWLFLGSSDTKEITQGTNISVGTVSFDRTYC